MSLVESLRATIGNLMAGPALAGFVKQGTLRRTTSEAYTPATGAAVTSTADYAVRLVWRSAQRGADLAGGGLTGDPESRQASVTGLAKGTQILRGDALIVEGVSYRVLSASDASAGEGIVWDVTVR